MLFCYTRRDGTCPVLIMDEKGKPMEKTVLITGASSGIGRACAGEFVNKGYKVFDLSRRNVPADGVVHIDCDVTDEMSAAQAIAQVEHVDILICNAGFGISGAVEFTDVQEAKRQIEVNLFGVDRMVRHVLPLMRKQGGGKIVLVSSVAAVLAIPFQTWYSVSKAAILAYGHGLQGEVRPFGIEVSTLLLGDIQSGFTAARKKQAVGDDVYEGRISRSVARMERDEQSGMRAEKAAKKIVRYVTKKHLAPTHTVGVQYKFFCLLQRILPTTLVRRIVEMLYAK